MMERRLRRQESASSALGGGSLPRPPNAAASGSLPPTAPNGNVSSGAVGAVADTATAGQWEEYCSALEGDYEELRTLFETQQAELASLSSLLAEKQLKESYLRSLEGQVAGHEGFLQEVLQLIALGDSGGRPALKPRGTVNTAGGAAGKRPSMDAVRDAIQKQQRRLQTLKESEKNNQAALRTLRKEGEPPATASSSASPSLHGTDCLVPASAKELDETRRRLSVLERRLQASEKDARNLTAELRKAEQALKLKDRSARQAWEDVEELKRLLTARDELLSSTEKRCRAAETELREAQEAKKPPSSPQGPPPSPNENTVKDTTSNGVGEKRLTTTPHFCLLRGDDFVDLLRTQPSAFQDALLQDISAAVHVPAAFLTEPRAHAVGEAGELAANDDAKEDAKRKSNSQGEKGAARADRKPSSSSSPGVGVDLMVKHNASLTAEAVDVLLLQCTFPSLAALKEQTARRTRALLLREAQEAKDLVRRKEEENRVMAERLKALEASLARKEADRAAHDEDVNGALEEAEATVKELYGALETQRKNDSALMADLAKAEADARSWEAKVGTVESKLAQTAKRCEELKQEAKTAALEYKKEIVRLQESLQAANVVVGIEAFEVPNGGVKLPSAALAEVVAALTAEGRPRGGDATTPSSDPGGKTVLEAFYSVLLCEVAVATGTVPIQVVRCACHKDAGGTIALLQLSVELAFYANPENTVHVRADIATKLASCSFAVAMGFLQHQWELSRSTTAAAGSDKAALEKDVKQLHGRLAALEKKLDSVLTVSERKAAPTSLGKLDLLIARLRGVESSLRESKDAATRKAAQMEALAASEAGAKDSVAALQEKVKRLEAALLEKQKKMDQRGADDVIEKLMHRIHVLEKKAAGAAPAPVPVPTEATAGRVKQLEEALQSAEKEKAALRRQVSEMETDMNELSDIQASLQSALEAAQTELRAKKQDLDRLAEQVLRLEERGKAQREEAEKLRRLRDHGSRADTADAPGNGGRAAAEDAATRGRGLPIPDTVSTPKSGGGLSLPPTASTAAPPGVKRIVKRSSSAAAKSRAFARIHSTPVLVASPASSTHAGGGEGGAAAAAGGAAEDAEVRGTTAPAATPSSAHSAPAAASVRVRGTVDAPPRLGSGGLSSSGVTGMRRQEPFSPSGSTTAAPKGGGGGGDETPPTNGNGGDVAPLTRERRHVSPVIGTASRRPPSPTANTAGAHAGNAFHRSLTATAVTSYVRTPSGYRKVNPSG